MADKKIMDKAGISKKLSEIADAVIQENKKDLANVVLVGIITRGAVLAERLAAVIKEKAKIEIPYGKLDVSIYRDDLDIRGESIMMRTTEIPVDINNKIVALIDDVIFKGRTVRAAMDVLNDYGRPSHVQLYTLLDRGGRELPIQPSFNGEKIEVSKNAVVQVLLTEIDEKEEVVIKKED